MPIETHKTSAPEGGAEDARKALCQKALWAALAIQIAGAGVFFFSTWTEVLHLRDTQLDWRIVETAEILGSIGLVLGSIVSALFLRRNHAELKDLRRQVDVANGEYASHLEELFVKWQLSASERDVAVCAMKGFSNAEIARMRATSVPTTKSQMSAVFKKSGHGNRQQLISFLVEEMLVGLPLSRCSDQNNDVSPEQSCAGEDTAKDAA